VIIKGLDYNEDTKEFEINKDICKIPKITRKNVSSSSEDVTEETSLTYEEENSESFDTGRDSGSLHSSRSLKKRWTKFLSEITKK
jgi:hypothetical protein